MSEGKNNAEELPGNKPPNKAGENDVSKNQEVHSPVEADAKMKNQTTTSGLSEEPTAEIQQLQTLNFKPQIKKMEVHHHGHVHEKKKWVEYLFQFFMLFLAVFCGFLAEYQLEHKIEADRVEKYMHDMVENLKYDTTRVAINLPDNRETRKELDSFRNEIKKAINGQANTNRLYYYSLKINDWGHVAFNKASIAQLKNSGQLRLVKNNALVNEILDYYERKVYAAEIYEQNTENTYKDFTAALNHVFSTTSFDFVANVSDSTFNQKILDDYKRDIQSVLTGQPLQLLNGDKQSLEKLHTATLQFEWALINYNRFLNYSRQGAEKLMLHIEEVY